MPCRKFAISVPAAVMAQVDLAAKHRRVTRRRFISDVLHRVAAVRRDAEITRRIDELFADVGLEREQVRTARGFNSAASPAGTEW